MAGARRDVSVLDIRGLRRRKGLASLVRRLSRSRRKKRRRSLWNKRMREREQLSRTFGDFQMLVRGLQLCQHHVQCCSTYNFLPFRRIAREHLCLYQIPCFEPRERHQRQPQRRANRSRIIIIRSLRDSLIFPRSRCPLANRRRARKEVLVKQLVLARADRVPERVAQYRIDVLRLADRGRRRGVRRRHRAGCGV